MFTRVNTCEYAMCVPCRLSTFLVSNMRRKVTSSAKKKREPGSARIAQTPDGSFYDLQRNAWQVRAPEWDEFRNRAVRARSSSWGGGTVLPFSPFSASICLTAVLKLVLASSPCGPQILQRCGMSNVPEPGSPEQYLEKVRLRPRKRARTVPCSSCPFRSCCPLPS
jgi:hypothetical protein